MSTLCTYLSHKGSPMESASYFSCESRDFRTRTAERHSSCAGPGEKRVHRTHGGTPLGAHRAPVGRDRGASAARTSWMRWARDCFQEQERHVYYRVASLSTAHRLRQERRTWEGVV